ncbi:MAG: sigma-54-dependent Fis family transcriptional regulator [Lysobacter sp.]|nr:sigma-54-dependent Fis family transcriptional regulator [Lysobacter sp.]
MSNPNASVLILDDDREFAQAAADLVSLGGMRPLLAHSIAESRQFAETRDIDLMLVDLSLPDGTAFDFLDGIDVTQHGQIALVTGTPSIESAARAVAQPFIDYLIKPLIPQRLEALFERARQRAAARLSRQTVECGLIGASTEMRTVIDAIGNIARTDASVLVAGESGTGKEVVANAIHQRSGRPGKFVAVNCGAIAPELLASQLFGHERGSFTGANNRHLGFVEQADKGTLFLDEITEMPLPLQVYLLRVLETGRFVRVGGLGEIEADVRIVAATNRNPFAAVQNGHLREDLYYRLADVQLDIPPLRSRGKDAVLLAEHFLDKLNQRYNHRKRLAPGVERLLVNHPWPGNVRELRSAVQRAYLLTDGDLIHVKPTIVPPAVLDETDTSVMFSVGMSYADIETKVLLKTLAFHNNDKSATARTLGVSVRTIHNQLARLRHAANG